MGRVGSLVEVLTLEGRLSGSQRSALGASYMPFIRLENTPLLLVCWLVRFLFLFPALDVELGREHTRPSPTLARHQHLCRVPLLNEDAGVGGQGWGSSLEWGAWRDGHRSLGLDAVRTLGRISWPSSAGEGFF